MTPPDSAFDFGIKSIHWLNPIGLHLFGVAMVLGPIDVEDYSFTIFYIILPSRFCVPAHPCTQREVQRPADLNMNKGAGRGDELLATVHLEDGQGVDDRGHGGLHTIL